MPVSGPLLFIISRFPPRRCLPSRTLHLSQMTAELILLFQNTLSAFVEEVIKARCKACHALAQVLEVEVDAGKLVCHRGRIGRNVGSRERGRERGLVCHGCHHFVCVCCENSGVFVVAAGMLKVHDAKCKQRHVRG